MTHRLFPVCSFVAFVWSAVAGAALYGDDALTVYHGLDEATRRISRLADKPNEKLIDADGFHQTETLIYTDTATGHEVWSLTMEQARDLANIERRGNWSSDGSVFSMKSNRVYRSRNGALHKTDWGGNSMLMEADLTQRRKLWAVHDGTLLHSNDKFDTWSRTRPRTLYYVEGEHLYRIDVGHGKDNAATLLYTFPDGRRRILQNIADNDLLLIQDQNGSQPGDSPLLYVIDTKLAPAAPGFVRSRSFNLGGLEGVEGHDPQNEYQVHAISIDRAGTHVGWNYGPSTSVGEYVHFKLSLDNFDAQPQWSDQSTDPYGQYMSHSGHGPNGQTVYFGGPVKLPSGERDADLNPPHPLGWGIWVREGREGEPKWIGGPAPGGHAQWGGNDPQWFTAHVSDAWADEPLSDMIVAGSPVGPDGPRLIAIANPYSRRREGTAGFDGYPRPIQSPDATKTWFHSSMMMPGNQYTGSFIVVARRPRAPQSLGEDDGKLVWTPHEVSNEVRNWMVYRRDGETWRLVAELPREQLSMALSGAQAGQYMVTALEWSGLESDVTSPTFDTSSGAVGPAVEDWDTTAPAPPGHLEVVLEEDGQYRLTWTPSPDEDVRYYNLYSSQLGKPEAVQSMRFVSPPGQVTSYLDWSAPLDGDMYYAITAVDRQGNESLPRYVPEPSAMAVTGAALAWLVGRERR